jgi:hypothetical protein
VISFHLIYLFDLLGKAGAQDAFEIIVLFQVRFLLPPASLLRPPFRSVSNFFFFFPAGFSFFFCDSCFSGVAHASSFVFFALEGVCFGGVLLFRGPVPCAPVFLLLINQERIHSLM